MKFRKHRAKSVGVCLLVATAIMISFKAEADSRTRRTPVCATRKASNEDCCPACHPFAGGSSARIRIVPPLESPSKRRPPASVGRVPGKS